MRVRIDSDRCQGHQMCAILAPAVFGSDDEGYGTVLVDGEIPGDHEEAAQRAAASCPEEAVILEGVS